MTTSHIAGGFFKNAILSDGFGNITCNYEELMAIVYILYSLKIQYYSFIIKTRDSIEILNWIKYLKWHTKNFQIDQKVAVKIHRFLTKLIICLKE